MQQQKATVAYVVACCSWLLRDANLSTILDPRYNVAFLLSRGNWETPWVENIVDQLKQSNTTHVAIPH